MPRHAALVAVSILTAGKSRDFFVMGCSAGSVLQEGVSFARKCGTCFSFMLELAKIQIAMFQGVGKLWLLLFWHPGHVVYSPNIFVLVNSIVSAITPDYLWELNRDLKEHLRRLQQQSDSRRRAAVNEMMRQRAAEVAANE
jgi:hypothetical protein